MPLCCPARAVEYRQRFWRGEPVHGPAGQRQRPNKEEARASVALLFFHFDSGQRPRQRTHKWPSMLQGPAARNGGAKGSIAWTCRSWRARRWPSSRASASSYANPPWSIWIIGTECSTGSNGTRRMNSPHFLRGPQAERGRSQKMLVATVGDLLTAGLLYSQP